MRLLQLPSSLCDEPRVKTGAEGMSNARGPQHAPRLNQEQLRCLLEGKVSITEPMIIAIGGLSGSGKSTLARTIGQLSIVAHISSDRTRSEMNSNVNSQFDQTYGTGIYSKEDRSRVYEEMFERARTALSTNLPVIIEATFLDPLDRSAIEELASAERVPFLGLWCEAPVDELRARVLRRAQDPNSDSDAGLRVLNEQLNYAPRSGITWVKISSSSNLDGDTGA